MLDADQIDAFIGMEKPAAQQGQGAQSAVPAVPPRTKPSMLGLAGLFGKLVAKP